ncbi:MAG: SpoIID/LytB domain-containing protein [Candidatus Metalachnospira sp.]|nr:SpoIID/LytB domain-containing protein [Clostridiales bacterium]
MRFFKKFVAALTGVSIFLAGSAVSVSAEELPEYIRVGLRMSYEEKSAISIESKNIKLVRSDDGITSPLLNETMAEFTSSDGFTVRVGLSYQVAVPIDADSYDEALNEANSYISDGYANAVPGYYKNNLAVIIYGYSDMSSANSAASSLNGIALSPNDVIILDMGGNPILLISNSDAYFMGDSGSVPVVDLGARSYRGIIDFMQNDNGTITAVNILDLEEYLYGVVASEIPSSYAFESIKAQACAARTYALYKWNRQSDVGFDICDSTHCQAYMGYDYESDTTNRAVDETEGELIYYNGKPIEALFFSSSGGYTEDAVNVWGTDVAYLKAVDDSQEVNCPKWTRTLTLSDLDKLIAVNGYNIGSATGMRITIDNKTNRVQKLEILGSKGTKTITLEACRTVLGSIGDSFNSRNYTITNGDVSGGSTSSSNKIGTFVYGPIKDFKVGKNYVIGSDCAVVYSTANGVKAVGYDGKEVDTDDITGFDIDKTQASGSSSKDGTTVITSSGPTIEITGYGIGHGVGMSQMGANGMAQNGATYKEILKHYYTGVTVK